LPEASEINRTKKSDWYEWEDYDLSGNIQDSIGCTAGGFPNVSREEIGEWLEAGEQMGYLWKEGFFRRLIPNERICKYENKPDFKKTNIKCCRQSDP
jgi:hypothetical protein